MSFSSRMSRAVAASLKICAAIEDDYQTGFGGTVTLFSAEAIAFDI